MPRADRPIVPLRPLVVLVLVAGLLGGLPGAAIAQEQPPPAEAADDPSPGGYPVSGGAFFTQALPDRTDGAGFAVVDGHGAALWSAFVARGGVIGLGYPVSRRFEWDGRVAQAFEHGVLRWDPTAGEAELLPREALPGGKLPDYALAPDFPPLAAAETAQRPWSGWWWPAFDGAGPTLFAPDGPLDRYDRYVALALGEDPGTRVWEREQVYFPFVRWAGHCNGWAAAALLEPEPTEPRETLGISFRVGDLKGLLSAYHFADAAAWSYGEGGVVDPADFHRTLLEWLAGEGKGFILTFDLGRGEVWSYPVYRFESAWGPDPEVPERWEVTTTVWMADNGVAPDFVGLEPFPGPEGKTFSYVLEGDPRDPQGGWWTGASAAGRFAHPAQIWYPEPRVRNLERQLASPNLDYGTIQNILAAAPADADAADGEEDGRAR